MDNHLLVSASNGQKAVDKPRTPEQSVDGDAFAKILDDKVNSSNKDSGKERDLISKDGSKEKTGKQQDKEANEKLERFQKTMGLKLETLVGNKNFIYNLALKDPGSLSLGERQALHLGEFSNAHLALKDFQQALSQKGLHLKDLSYTQMSLLSRCHSKEELAQRVDTLNVTHPTPGEAALVTRTPEKNSRYPNSPLSAAYTELKTSPPQHVQGASKARQMQEADVRRQRREEVIRQVMVHIDVQNFANKTEVALKLNPEFLGDMKIKLRFEGRGHVGADFETTSQETKDLIDDDMESLRTAFSNKGMTLTEGRTHLVESVS